MFSRKPQTALTEKKRNERNHTKQVNKTPRTSSLKPATGYATVNGIAMPY